MSKLACKIELSKKKGIILTVEDKDNNTIQVIEMDGSSIKTTMKKSNASSIIIQDAEHITIKCKNFTVDADTIVYKSKKDTTINAQGVIDINSNKDMYLESSKNIKAKATSNLDLEASNLDIKSKQKINATGNDVNIHGLTNTKIDTVQLQLRGEGKAELEGSLLNIKGIGMLSIESEGISEIKGSIINIQGIVRFG